MYLFHNTTYGFINQILHDGYLYSSSLTGNISEGEAIYHPRHNKFVYFLVTDKIDNENIIGRLVMFFDTKLLENRTYYVDNQHTSHPTKKYPQYYPNTKKVLTKLHNDSVLEHSKYFQVCQQIAVMNKASLKHLVAIKFKTKPPSPSILKILKSKYPHVKIIGVKKNE